jgi:putative endonuclease
LNSNTHKIGRIAEEMAILFLKEQSYELIEKNWRFKNFEIDIVAKNSSTLIFVEVKSRTNSILSTVDIITSAQKKKNYKSSPSLHSNK